MIMPAALSNEGVSQRAGTSALAGRTCQVQRQHTRQAAEHEEPLLADGKLVLRPRGVLRHSPWDALFITLALAHGLALIEFSSIPLIAIGFWWNANTIAHNFIHRPFFRARRLNAVFSTLESLVLGIPQRLWRDRHLAHHGDRPWRWRWSRQLAWETGLVLSLLSGLLARAPEFFLTVYLPGWLTGLALCQLQGHLEHERGTTSHYGRLYNLLFFNDGYHVEHHARPSEHWRRLPEQEQTGAAASRWPAVLRWLERINLDGLERLVLRSQMLQRFVLKNHERAFRALLPELANIRRVGIVGGGMFPRTTLILQRLLPNAHLTIIDASEESLQSARRFVNVEFIHGFFDASEPVLKIGGAGDPPAPVGDPPTGTGASNVAKRPCPLARIVAPVPSGESPDGTGGSPVLPVNHFSNTPSAVARSARSDERAEA